MEHPFSTRISREKMRPSTRWILLAAPGLFGLGPAMQPVGKASVAVLGLGQTMPETTAFFGGGTHGFWWRCSQPTHWYPPGQFLWIPSHRRVYVIFVGDGTPSTTLISDTSIHRSHSHEICLQAFSLGICKRYDGAAFSQNLRKTAVHLIV